jgi:type I restriction enzyme M protein
LVTKTRKPSQSRIPTASWCQTQILTDYENVPYLEDIDDYFAREVLPHVPDAWLDESFTDARDGQLGRVGYEINFNRFFYQYQPPRKLQDIDENLKQVEAEIAALLAEVASE